MKIVLLGNIALYFIPRINALVEYAEKNGHEFILLEANQGTFLYKNIPRTIKVTCETYTIEKDTPKNLRYDQKVFYILDKLKPDVLITGFISFPYGAIGLKWAKSRHKGIVEYDDQRLNTFPRNKIISWIKSRIIRNVDAFLCPAPAWDETLLSWGFHKEEIFYGLDTSDNEFWCKRVENTDFKDLPSIYFMTVGRQTKMKNLPFFLKAYKTYLEQGGKIPLVMVGNGPEHEKLIEIANNDSHITFIDFQPRENIRQLFVRMKALVLPSTKVETWGMVVNECMASGHVVAISKECGSATTLVKHNVNGFHFSPDNKEEIVEALFKIQDLSDEEYQNMKSASLNIIKDWGVDRFVAGAMGACQYAYTHHKPLKNPIDKLLIYLWKGRYNIAEATQ